jgi:CubicO group peptidase (beta-lactamase class C family)
VNTYVQEQVAKRRIPGLSLAVVRGGEILYAKGYGMADVERAVPATPETVYELASVSKQFTATAVMMLVEEGKFKLDDSVADRLVIVPQAWRDVTVRNLLNHTSGIKDYLGTKDISFRKDYTNDELIGMVAKLPLDFAPGEKWSYSNTNYVLLGMLIEKANGQSLADFLARRIFDPLGMKSSRVNDTLAVIPNRATGYERAGGVLRIRDFVSPTLAATGDGEVVSSVLDLAKWDAALDQETLLKRPVLQQMWTPATLKDGKKTHYGFGWGVGEQNGHQVVSHSGGFPGFNANISRYPQDRLTVIVLANTSSAGADRIARGVASKYVPALAEPETAAIPDEDAVTTRKLKAVVIAMLDGQLEADLFTPEAKKDHLPEKVQEVGKSIAPLGPLKSFELIGRKPEGGLRVHSYRAVFGETALVLTFTLTGDGQIAGLTLVPE